jgi:hypothetical protein
VPDVKQKGEELVREAERGRSERAPWLTLGGVHLAVIAVFLVVFAIAFTANLIA